jgi:hypothetical protein
MMITVRVIIFTTTAAATATASIVMTTTVTIAITVVVVIPGLGAAGQSGVNVDHRQLSLVTCVCGEEKVEKCCE